MANVIDALIVTLGLDSSNFQQGSREATRTMDKFTENAQRDTKAVMLASQQMSRGFRAVRNELMGLLALSVGGYGAGRLVANTIGDQAQLGRFSNDLGMSARQLDAWGRMVTAVGGKAEDAQQSMLGVADAVQSFLRGESPEVTRIMYSIGVNPLDDEGNIRPMHDVFMDIAEGIQDANPLQQRNIADSLGISYGMLSTLREAGNREGLEDRFSQYFQASNITEGSVQASQEAQRAFAELNAEIRGVWQTLYNDATPAMGQLTDLLREFGTWLNENRDDVEGFFTGIVDGVENIGDVLDIFTDETDDATQQITVLTAAIVALAGAAALIGGRGGLLRMLGRGGIAGLTAYLGMEVAEWGDEWLDDTPLGELNRALGQYITDAQNSVAESGAKLGGQIDSAGQSGAAIGSKEWVARMLGVDYESVNGMSDEQQSTARYIIEYFMAQGWTRDQATGIAANLHAESAFDPTAVGDNGQAYGLAQWHPDRQARFEEQFGYGIRQSSFDDQLKFIQHEMTEGQERRAGEMLRRAESAAEAASIVTQEYERPANAEERARQRAALAEGLYAKTSDIEGLYGNSPVAINIEGEQLESEIGQAEPSVSQTVDEAPPFLSKGWFAQIIGVEPIPEHVAETGSPDGESGTVDRQRSLTPLIEIPAPNLPVGATANAGVSNSTSNVTTTTTETHIGTVEVHTAATDSAGIARDIGEDLRRNELINASTTGMN